jgi:gamma-glutamyltranspeptidase/glutathione hydrolase
MLALDEAEASAPPADGSDPLIDPVAHMRDKVRAFRLRDAYCTDPRRIALPGDALAADALLHNGEPADGCLTRAGGGDTSTFVVVDRDGRAVSWVQSLFEEFGSGVACPEQGVVLQNRAALEQLNDDAVHGLRGGFRPFHTLCPAIATGSDGVLAALATPGDHGQPQTLALVLRRHFQQGLDIQAAIEWPRLRHDAGREVMLEDRCPPSWDSLLAADGWSARRVGAWSRLMGGVNAIVRRPDGLLMAGADPRRSSYAVCA